MKKKLMVTIVLAVFAVSLTACAAWNKPVGIARVLSLQKKTFESGVFNAEITLSGEEDEVFYVHFDRAKREFDIEFALQELRIYHGKDALFLCEGEDIEEYYAPDFFDEAADIWQIFGYAPFMEIFCDLCGLEFFTVNLRPSDIMAILAAVGQTEIIRENGIIYAGAICRISERVIKLLPGEVKELLDSGCELNWKVVIDNGILLSTEFNITAEQVIPGIFIKYQ